MIGITPQASARCCVRRVLTVTLLHHAEAERQHDSERGAGKRRRLDEARVRPLPRRRHAGGLWHRLSLPRERMQRVQRSRLCVAESGRSRRAQTGRALPATMTGGIRVRRNRPESARNPLLRGKNHRILHVFPLIFQWAPSRHGEPRPPREETTTSEVARGIGITCKPLAAPCPRKPLKIKDIWSEHFEKLRRSRARPAGTKENFAIPPGFWRNKIRGGCCFA
jgi:hypothetical protein